MFQSTRSLYLTVIHRLFGPFIAEAPLASLNCLHRELRNSHCKVRPYRRSCGSFVLGSDEKLRV